MTIADWRNTLKMSAIQKITDDYVTFSRKVTQQAASNVDATLYRNVQLPYYIMQKGDLKIYGAVRAEISGYAKLPRLTVENLDNYGLEAELNNPILDEFPQAYYQSILYHDLISKNASPNEISMAEQLMAVSINQITDNTSYAPVDRP